MFIVVEGIDGSGKTSAVEYISEALTQKGIKNITTREPGGTVLGEQVRDLMLSGDNSRLTDLLLVFANRVDHIERVIIPALDAGKVVITDRYTTSSYNYQVRGDNSLWNLYHVLLAKVEEMVTVDLELHMEIELATAVNRMGIRGCPRTRYEKEAILVDGIMGLEEIRDSSTREFYAINANDKLEQVQLELSKFVDHLVLRLKE